jgi:NitT/TauT family transport system substrate-binding protein
MKRSLFACAAAALLLSGTVTAPAQSQDSPEIVIASSTFDSATAGYYAYKTGMFKKAGLNVTFTAMAPPGIPAAVASGAVQIASNNLFSLVEARARNVPFVLIAPGASFDKTDEDGYVGLIVKKSSTLQTGKDFVGKTVGVNEVKGFNALAAMTWIDQTGGDSTKVKFVEIPAPAAAAAVSSGRIDATILTVPFLGAALALGDVKVLTDSYSSIAKSYLGLAWVTTQAYADAHPDVIAKFSRVIRDAAIYVNAHHEDSVQMMSELAKVDPSTFRGITRVTFAPYLTPAMVQPVIDVSAKYHVIEKSFNAADMISPNAIKPGTK